MSKTREGYKRLQIDVTEECYELLKKIKKDQRVAIGQIVEDALEQEYYFKMVK